MLILKKSKTNKEMKKKESIFFVTLPKSGTVFTWDSLEIATGLNKPNLSENNEEWSQYRNGLDYHHSTIYASGDFATQRLLPESIKKYLPNGYVFGAHMCATYHNIQTLINNNVRKIVVLLRDPCDATVSWSHHLKKYGETERNYHSKIYYIPSNFFEKDYSEQLSYHVRNFLPMAINWIESWLDYYANEHRHLDMLIVYYDELKKDPQSYIEKLLNFYDYKTYDLSILPKPEKGLRHFRKGEHGAWNYEFSEDDKSFTELLVKNRLKNAYELAAQAHKGYKQAKIEIKNDNYKLALIHLNNALLQFPMSKSIIEITQKVLSQLDNHEYSLQTSCLEYNDNNIFQYPDDIIVSMKNTINGVSS